MNNRQDLKDRLRRIESHHGKLWLYIYAVVRAAAAKNQKPDPALVDEIATSIALCLEAQKTIKAELGMDGPADMPEPVNTLPV